MRRIILGFFERKSAIVPMFVCGIVAVFLAGGYFLNASANKIVTIQAERESIAWATYIGSQINRIEEIAAGADLTTTDQDFLAGARKFGNIFRFKLFDRNGTIRLISDDLYTDLANNPDLVEDNWKAVLVVETGEPYTQLEDGTLKPDRPDLYAETYVPVVRNGKLVAVAEVYIDETATARSIRADFMQFGLKIGGVMLFGLSLPGITLVIVLRRLREKNEAQKRAEAALRGSEKRFGSFASVAPVGIFHTDADGRVTYVNDKWCEIGDISFDEAMGDGWQSALHPKEKVLVTDKWDKFSEDGSIYQFEQCYKRKDGTATYCLVQAMAEIDGDGQVIGYVGTVTDITEHKQAEDALQIALVDAERANQTKSEFLSAMSHELRTPLNAILGFSDILSEQYFGPPGAGKYQEYARDIHRSGQHLLDLVNDLLDISTIEAGKISLDKETLPVKKIVGDCARIIDEKIRSKGIHLTTDVMDDISSLYADKRAVKQILLNLLWNAVKFTPKGGTISVSVRLTRQNTEFTIADTGVGIPANQLSSVTDPFTRIEKNPHITDAGWGLGLSITKSLIELHDGEMSIDSQVGKGTIVTVTFPSQESVAD